MNRAFSLEIKDIIQYPSDGIFSKVLAKGPGYNYTLMCLSAGTDIDTHTSTKNGCVYVIEGEGDFTLDDQAVTMRPGTVIVMPANVPHALKAKENTAILLCLSA